MILAAGTSGNPTLDIAAYIIQFGVVGLLLLDITVTRKVFVPRWTLDQEKQERERERGDRDALIVEQKATILRLTNLAEDQVIPALTRATEVNRDYLQLLQERRRDK